MHIQYIIVAIVLIASLAYLVYRLAYVFRHKNDPCYGCQLKDACLKKTILQQRNTPNRGQCGSPCSDCARLDNSGTARRGRSLPHHHTRK